MEDTRMLEEPDLFISLNNAGGHGCSTLGRWGSHVTDLWFSFWPKYWPPSDLSTDVSLVAAWRAPWPAPAWARSRPWSGSRTRVCATCTAAWTRATWRARAAPCSCTTSTASPHTVQALRRTLGHAADIITLRTNIFPTPNIFPPKEIFICRLYFKFNLKDLQKLHGAVSGFIIEMQHQVDISSAFPPAGAGPKLE